MMVSGENQLKKLINVWTASPRTPSHSSLAREGKSESSPVEVRDSGSLENGQPGRSGDNSASFRLESFAEQGLAVSVDSAAREFPDPDFEVPVQGALVAADQRIRELKEAQIEGRTDDGSVNVLLDGRGRYKEIRIAEQLATYPTRMAPRLVVAIARGRAELARRLADNVTENEDEVFSEEAVSRTLSESMASILDAGTRDFDMPTEYRAVVDEALEGVARICDIERAHAHKVFERDVARKAGRIQMSGDGTVMAIELRDHAVRDLGIAYLKVQLVADLNGLLDATENALVEAYKDVIIGGVPIGKNVSQIRQCLGLCGGE